MISAQTLGTYTCGTPNKNRLEKETLERLKYDELVGVMNPREILRNQRGFSLLLALFHD